MPSDTDDTEEITRSHSESDTEDNGPLYLSAHLQKSSTARTPLYNTITGPRVGIHPIHFFCLFLIFGRIQSKSFQYKSPRLLHR